MSILPEGKQNEVMALPAKGHIVVLGTAGSGKTTIALLRARHLASLPGNPEVLLVTFNGALVEYMHGISDSLPRNLTIEKYHEFARGYLNCKGKMPCSNGILGPTEKKKCIEEAVEIIKQIHPSESTLLRPCSFFIDEITFIEQFGYVDLLSYSNAERFGRGAANIKRENRHWVYDVYIEYKKLRKKKGYKYDWDDVAFYTYQEFTNDNSERRYKHIIVDEGQDFSPMMIKSLVAAVQEDGSFTFFGDVAQQIYGNRLSWRDSGINSSKIWRFNINYRNPSTIIAFAKDITESEYWQQDSDMVEAVAQIAKGPKPILIKFLNSSNEVEWIASKAVCIAKMSSVVIICRDRLDIDLFFTALKNINFNATEINKDTPGFATSKTIYLSTFHAAKGLEFEYVFIPFLSDDKFPRNDIIANATSKKMAYANEIKLLYVAVTRSKYGLYMSYNGNLSPLFPKSNNYDCYTEDGLHERI